MNGPGKTGCYLLKSVSDVEASTTLRFSIFAGDEEIVSHARVGQLLRVVLETASE
jgi:hypothetical protein